MIFIVIGIVILIISFIIALISLVREQKLIEEEQRELNIEEDQSRKEINAVSDFPTGKIHESNINVLKEVRPHEEEIASEIKTDKRLEGEKEPFFWEVKADKDLGLNNYPGSNIKNEVSGQIGRNLSGEISIRDISDEKRE